MQNINIHTRCLEHSPPEENAIFPEKTLIIYPSALLTATQTADVRRKLFPVYSPPPVGMIVEQHADVGPHGNVSARAFQQLPNRHLPLVMLRRGAADANESDVHAF
jgi:hypothetical protein